MKKLLFITFIFIYSISIRAEIVLPGIFCDNMVLQRDQPVKIWGWADKGEPVLVEFCGEKAKTRASKYGKWEVTIGTFPFGGPFELIVKGKNNSIALKDILIGDVWVCSGQSNMGMSVNGSLNAQEEIASANYPRIRLFTVSADINNQQQEDVPGGSWVICSPETVVSFSAAGFFFGRDLYRDLNIPIGLVNSSVGGTNIEAWMSRDAIQKFPEYSDKVEQSTSADFGKRMEESLADRRKWSQKMEEDVNFLPDFIRNGELIKTGAEMELPQRWEDKLLPGIDGIVWFQKEIQLSDQDAENDIIVNLCLIDDAEETYWNGTLVGATNGYNKARNYKLEKGIVRPGKNILSIKVRDGGGSGGIRGECKDFYYEVNDHKYSLCGEWAYKPWIVNDSRLDVSANDYPSLLYNSKIFPLTHLPIKGAIWYQGESNTSGGYQYRDLFKSMITDWREKWGQSDFPFLIVQLANCGEEPAIPAESGWAELRESQSEALDLPNTGLAVAIDIGEADDIHPKNKQEVGRRLALAALKVAYGKDLVYSGPKYTSMEVKGNKIILAFDHIGTGLKANDKYGYLKGFSIAGPDKKFVWGRAFIQGENVVVYSPEIAKPLAVRYGWADNPGDVNLYNNEGLPASPFRTDDWGR